MEKSSTSSETEPKRLEGRIKARTQRESDTDRKLFKHARKLEEGARRRSEAGSETGLPDGYSQIFRSYVFGPSGFWTMAPLRYAAKFDPFGGRGGAIQGKEGIKFCSVA